MLVGSHPLSTDTASACSPDHSPPPPLPPSPLPLPLPLPTPPLPTPLPPLPLLPSTLALVLIGALLLPEALTRGPSFH
ncbi:hypothetical protein Jiend_19060 [Micromonospora endophytica]|nr:hypothetical protein Jiend_19060 [Micromonospora endophytica]